MRKGLIMSVAAIFLLAILLSLPVAAQQQNPQELKDKKVQNAQGEEIGKIKDVIASPDGWIEAVIIEKGGFMGIGEKEQTIPWSAIKEGQDQDYLVYDPKADKTAATQQQAGGDTGRQVSQQHQQLIGKAVEDNQGEQLGKIEEVVPGTEGETYAVISGEDDKLYPVQMQALKTSGQQDKVQANFDKQKMQQGPSFSKDQWQNLSEQQWQPEVRAYYGEQQSQRQQGGEQAGGQISVRQPAPQVEVEPAQPQVQVDQPPPKVTVKQPPPKVTIEQPEPEVTVEQPKPEVTVKQPKPEVNVWQQEPEVSVKESKPQVQIEEPGQAQVQVEKQGQPQVEVERQGQPQVNVAQGQQQQGQRAGEQQQKRASGLVDASKGKDWLNKKVISQNGEELGTVKKNYLSEDGNTILYVIVQGEDDKMHPVPAGMVRKDQGKNELTAAIDKNTFAQSPSFGERENPDLDETQWSQEIRSYYDRKAVNPGMNK